MYPYDIEVRCSDGEWHQYVQALPENAEKLVKMMRRDGHIVRVMDYTFVPPKEIEFDIFPGRWVKWKEWNGSM